jgi:hypothetical protein
MNKRDPLPYLQRMLKLNPLNEADDAVRLRNRFLGIATSTVAADSSAEETLKLRESLLKRIDRIRDAFWTADSEALQRNLTSLNVSRHPDLRATVERLLRALEVRPQFPQLLDHRSTDANLFNVFKRAAIMPRKDAAELKQRLLAKVRTRDQRRRVSRMAKRVKRSFPDLYELEPEWWDQLLSFKSSILYLPANVLGRIGGEIPESAGVGVFLWGMFLLMCLSIIVPLIITFFNVGN